MTNDSRKSKKELVAELKALREEADESAALLQTKLDAAEARLEASLAQNTQDTARLSECLKEIEDKKTRFDEYLRALDEKRRLEEEVRTLHAEVSAAERQVRTQKNRCRDLTVLLESQRVTGGKTVHKPEKRKVKIDGKMQRSRVISYLEDLTRGFREGYVTVSDNKTAMVLAPSIKVSVSVKATRKRDEEHFAIEMSWPRMALTLTESLKKDKKSR